jgi:UDP-N-acetylglucosamine 1-carboxyvinyltransferase
MSKFIIQGGVPLKGVVRLGGAKNASFKLMIASLLCSHENKLLNFSNIRDVELVKKIIQSLGVKIYSAGERTMFIKAEKIKKLIVAEDLGLASRASGLFLAPLLVRCGKALVPFPGGDKIGHRPLERHLEGLKALGAEVIITGNFIKASCRQLIGTTYSFAKPSHTGTETMIMAAVLARGQTIIKNAALEPEVDNLIDFLNHMGAKIKRLSGRVIKITGVKELFPVVFKVMPDRNEAVSYAIAALITQGEVVVENARAQDLTAFLNKFKEANGAYEIADYGIRFYYNQPLKSVNVTTKPHPGFMSDWQPLWAVLATQCQGTSRIIETIFTHRFQYVTDLQSMGAKILIISMELKLAVKPSLGVDQ